MSKLSLKVSGRAFVGYIFSFFLTFVSLQRAWWRNSYKEKAATNCWFIATLASLSSTNLARWVTCYKTACSPYSLSRNWIWSNKLWTILRYLVRETKNRCMNKTGSLPDSLSNMNLINEQRAEAKGDNSIGMTKGPVRQPEL